MHSPTPHFCRRLAGLVLVGVALYWLAPGAPAEPPPAPGPKVTPREMFAYTLGWQLQQHKTGWDGIVFDLSEVPVDKALPLLEALDPPPAPSTATVGLQKGN